MRLAVIIPTFNGLEHLRTCLPSVLTAASCAKVATEIIVVDDGSTDGTVDWLRQEHPLVRVIARPDNGGFAKAANAGLRAADADWIALVNNDVRLDPAWIASALPNDPPSDVGALATRILWQDQPDVLYSAGDEYATCGVALPWGRGQAAATLDQQRQCFSACAAAALYRADALAKCGLFRERLGAYYEDVDLGLRLNLAGYRCLYVPTARAWHVGGGSYGRRSWRVAYHSARNRELVFWGRLPAALLWRYAPGHLVVACGQLLCGLATMEIVPRAAGLIAALGHAGEVLRIRQATKALTVISPVEFQKRLCRHGLRFLWRRATGGH